MVMSSALPALSSLPAEGAFPSLPFPAGGSAALPQPRGTPLPSPSAETRHGCDALNDKTISAANFTVWKRQRRQRRPLRCLEASGMAPLHLGNIPVSLPTCIQASHSNLRGYKGSKKTILQGEIKTDLNMQPIKAGDENRRNNFCL